MANHFSVPKSFVKNIEGAQKKVEILIPPADQKFQERPTVVFIHGWIGYFKTLSETKFDKLPEYFGRIHNVNVVTVRWETGSLSTYSAAVYLLPEVAKDIAAYLDEKLGGDPTLWSNLTIVGYSLGAHLSGKVLKKVSLIIQEI